MLPMGVDQWACLFRQNLALARRERLHSCNATMLLTCWKKMLRDMLLARAFEERAAQEYTRGNIACFLHLYPGEVAVGVLHGAELADYIVTTCHEHVHA